MLESQGKIACVIIFDGMWHQTWSDISRDFTNNNFDKIYKQKLHDIDYKTNYIFRIYMKNWWEMPSFTAVLALTPEKKPQKIYWNYYFLLAALKIGQPQVCSTSNISGTYSSSSQSSSSFNVRFSMLARVGRFPPYATFTTNGFKEEIGVFWHLLLKTKEHFTTGCPSC